MYTPERIYCTKADYHIDLTEDILEDDAKLRQGVKEVMGVIIGLLKDRVEVDDALDSKRARTKKYIKEWVFAVISLDVMYHRLHPEHLYLFLHVIIKKFSWQNFLISVHEVTS